MPRLLALDWDSGSTHLLSATVSKGGLQIDRALVWPDEQPPSQANAEAFGQRLKDRLKEAGIAPAPLLIALGRDRVILKDVRYPAVPPHEEPAIVRFQTVKELTDAPDEVVIDYQANETPEPSGERKALAVAVRKDVLQACQTIAKAAGLKLAGIAPRAFGVIACVRRTASPAPEPGTAFASLAIGHKSGEFAAARGEHLVFARSLSGPSIASDAALLGEVRRNLAVYSGQNAQHPIQALYIAEPSNLTLGVGDRLRDSLPIAIHRFDPLAGIDPPQGSTAGSFAGMAGLLHLFGRSRMPINFIAPREPKPPVDPNRRILTWAAIAAGVLLLAGGAVGYAMVSAKDRELSELNRQRNELDEDLQRKYDADERRIAAVDQWQKSEIVWLDELYNLTARFPQDISKLRLSELSAEPMPLPPPSPGKQVDSMRPVARVRMKGLSTEDDRPLSSLMRNLVEDAARVDPKQVAPNGGQNRRDFRQQWSTSYYLSPASTGKTKREFTATPPSRENRNRGRGFDFMDIMGDFNPGGLLP